MHIKTENVEKDKKASIGNTHKGTILVNVQKFAIMGFITRKPNSVNVKY